MSRDLKLRAEVILKLSGEPTGLRCGHTGKRQPTGAAVMPGNGFVPGDSFYLRIAYATTQSKVDEAPVAPRSPAGELSSTGTR